MLAAEKERIAKAALDEVPEDGAILLDAGTTTGRLAEILPSERELTVVTNSVPIVIDAGHAPNLSLLLGGRGPRRHPGVGRGLGAARHRRRSVDCRSSAPTASPPSAA